MVVAVEEQVNAHGVERILAVVDVIVAYIQRIMVGGIRACVRHNDAPFLVGSIQHALAPLQLFLHDLCLLVGRRNLAVQDYEDRVAVLKVAHCAVELRIAGVRTRHIEALCERYEIPVALHLVVACNGNSRILGVVIAHNFKACLPFGGLIAVLSGVACGDHQIRVRADLERLIDRILEAHVVLYGLRLRVRVEDNAEILIRSGLRCGERLFLAHEAAAVAYAVYILGRRFQAGDFHTMCGFFLIACGYGFYIRGAGLALPLGSALDLVLNNALGDSGVSQPAEAQAALLGIRRNGDLIGFALYLAVINIQHDRLGLGVRLGYGFLVGLNLDIVEHIAGLIGRQRSGVGAIRFLHGNSGIDLGRIIAVVQGRALYLVAGDDAGRDLGLAVMRCGVQRAGDDARTADGVIHCGEDGGIIAAQNRLLAGGTPVPNLAHIPAECFIGGLILHFCGGNILPLNRLLGRLVAGQQRALPCNIAGDVGSCLVVELTDDLIHVRNAVDNGLCRNAVLERFTGVERACNTARMTYRAALCDGIDRTGCKAACQIAAAVLNAGNAARIIRSGNVCVDVAVLNMTDDRAFALLQLAADTACGVRVGQIQALNLTGDNTAGNRTVVDACQRADVLLTGNVAVEQRNILDIRLIVLIADIAEQAGIFLFIFYAQSLDRMELTVKCAGKALILFGSNRLKSFDAGHINIGSQNIMSIAGSAVPPAAGQIEQLVRGRDFIAACCLIIYRRLSLVAGSKGSRREHRQSHCSRQRQTEYAFFHVSRTLFLKILFLSRFCSEISFLLPVQQIRVVMHSVFFLANVCVTCTYNSIPVPSEKQSHFSPIFSSKNYAFLPQRVSAAARRKAPAGTDQPFQRELFCNYPCLRAMARSAAAAISSAVRLYCCIRKSCGPT